MDSVLRISSGNGEEMKTISEYKDGVYMFVNSDLIVVDGEEVIYPDHLWFWLERDFEIFMNVSVYLGEL